MKACFTPIAASAAFLFVGISTASAQDDATEVRVPFAFTVVIER